MNQSHSMETMELNILQATLSDQQKSHEPSAHRTFSQEGPDTVSHAFIPPTSPLRRSKALLLKNLCKQSFSFIMLITSYYCLAKTNLFNCLISPSHYSIQYFLYWRQAAYRAQLYRSVLVMVRHACAEKRKRGRAARHSLRVRRGFLAWPGNDSREISFHDSLPCLQNRIGEGTSRT